MKTLLIILGIITYLVCMFIMTFVVQKVEEKYKLSRAKRLFCVAIVLLAPLSILMSIWYSVFKWIYKKEE